MKMSFFDEIHYIMIDCQNALINNNKMLNVIKEKIPNIASLTKLQFTDKRL